MPHLKVSLTLETVMRIVYVHLSGHGSPVCPGQSGRVTCDTDTICSSPNHPRPGAGARRTRHPRHWRGVVWLREQHDHQDFRYPRDQAQQNLSQDKQQAEQGIKEGRVQATGGIEAGKKQAKKLPGIVRSEVSLVSEP
jgi:hypothetical protein